MSETKSKLLLLLGCQRSGTTLLASLLGGHSEINMLFESTTTDVTKLIGKKYSGNKLLAYRQIRMDSRASKWGHLMNRMVNFDVKKAGDTPHKRRMYPTSVMSTSDYIKDGAKIISIVRSKEEVVSSILKRTEAKRKIAEFEYDKSIEEIDKVNDMALRIDFYDLIHNTQETLYKVCEFLEIEFQPRMLEGTKYNFVYPNDKIVTEKSTATKE